MTERRAGDGHNRQGGPALQNQLHADDGLTTGGVQLGAPPGIDSPRTDNHAADTAPQPAAPSPPQQENVTAPDRQPQHQPQPQTRVGEANVFSKRFERG